MNYNISRLIDTALNAIFGKHWEAERTYANNQYQITTGEGEYMLTLLNGYNECNLANLGYEMGEFQVDFDAIELLRERIEEYHDALKEAL